MVPPIRVHLARQSPPEPRPQEAASPELHHTVDQPDRLRPPKPATRAVRAATVRERLIIRNEPRPEGAHFRPTTEPRPVSGQCLELIDRINSSFKVFRLFVIRSVSTFMNAYG
jgi:hypothetical protein